MHGVCGLRVLFGCKTFNSKDYVNNVTGEIIPNDLKDPIIILFQNVLTDIKHTREEFENVPDTAFFTKRVGRYTFIFYLFELFHFSHYIIKDL